jgi:hypothetical protein
VGYQLDPKLRLGFRYGVSHRFYSVSGNPHLTNPKTNNQRTENYAYSIQYDWTPKTRLNLQLHHSDRDYFEQGLYGSQTQGFGAGMLMRIGPKFTLSQKLEYTQYRYARDAYLDDNGWSYRTGLHYYFTPKLTLSTYYDRGLNEDIGLSSLSGDTSLLEITRSIGANLDWSISPLMHFGLYARAIYDESQMQTTISDPEDQARTFSAPLRDQDYVWGADFNWRFMKNADWYIGYRYSNRNSNMKTRENEDHQIRSAVRWLFL